MSTPERADDPGEHGYGGVGVEKDKDRDREDAPRGSDEDGVGGVDERRHVVSGWKEPRRAADRSLRSGQGLVVRDGGV